MLYKSPCRRHRCHYVSFASEEVELRKRKKKKTRKNTFVYLKNRKSSLKQKKKNNKNLKPKEDPKKSLITIETIYQSLLTYLKKLYEKLPGKNKTNPRVKLLSLETWNLKSKPLEKRKTNIKKANYVYSCLFGTLNVLQKTKRSLSRARK